MMIKKILKWHLEPAYSIVEVLIYGGVILLTQGDGLLTSLAWLALAVFVWVFVRETLLKEFAQ